MQVTLKPKKGLRVKDPFSKIPLKAEGTSKALSTYWRRRINAGDVTIVKNQTKIQTSKEEKEK